MDPFPFATQKQLSELKDSPCHADETRWQVFILTEGKSGYRQYLWVFRTPSATYYVLDPTRSASVPFAHFKTVEDRIIIVCGSSRAYKSLAKQGGVLLAFCWAHVRRDFLNVVKGWPALSGWGMAWVEHIGRLYPLNHQRLGVLDQPALFAECDARLRAQVQAMARHRDEQLADPSLPITVKKTRKSLQNHWQGLTLFVDYPLVPMDNNAGEQALRTPVVGRKNYDGSGSLWSGDLAAMLFTVLMTMTHWEINPRRWLTEYLRVCAANGNQPPEDLTPHLPWAMNETHLASLRALADTS
ncbi:MAG: IS66 family transposase [Gammaproteobacteria bacterium]